MESILTILKSIDFWTIVGSVGSVAGAVFAVFALSGYNKKSKYQERLVELKAKASKVEDLVSNLIGSYEVESKLWTQHAQAQPSTWESTEPEFKSFFSGTMTLYKHVAIALDSLMQQPELAMPRYATLADAALSLGRKVNQKMSFRQSSNVDLDEALQKLREARFRL